jgi:hypothetical protein
MLGGDLAFGEGANKSGDDFSASRFLAVVDESTVGGSLSPRMRFY